jgi:hypothetical protein
METNGNKKGKGYDFSRRSFLKGTAAMAAFMVPYPGAAHEAAVWQKMNATEIHPAGRMLDLSPARWIWFPAGRTLPNTFFHFRKSISISKPVQKATGWILGDSRYLFFCDSKRIQFGPPPADPRFAEADPLELTDLLQPGEHVLGATVLYYGFGDGTWPTGKPGFIFKLDLVYQDGTREEIVSDSSWQVQLAESWPAGQYKRWYLRALQEVFDARKYPFGWNAPGFVPDGSWLPAKELEGSAAQTAISAGGRDYLNDASADAPTQLRRRAIPMLKEWVVAAKQFHEAHWLQWVQPVKAYFDLLVEGAYQPVEGPEPAMVNDWLTVEHPGSNRGLVLTFSMEEQLVGWPVLEVEAPEGTHLELMVQEGHVPFPQGPALMNNHFHSWTRFITREGHNTLTCFDFESVKWLQLHIHGVQGNVRVKMPAVLRRAYDFPALPLFKTSDPALNKLLEASVNTVVNNSQDTIVDGMGRERQQYSGDIGHVVHALHRAFGETRLPARFIGTYSQGITSDGFFLDTWPAFDRLNRLAQRQVGLTPWGPLLDHGVGFQYDCFYHYQYTGAKADLEEVFPRQVRFFRYLQGMVAADGLLPVENLGVPAIWMDTDAYRQQKHKQCAFNLYVAGMLKDAFSPVCEVFARTDLAKEARAMSGKVLAAVRKKYWSARENMLVVNLPWLAEEKEARTCERSIAHYVLSGFASRSELPALLGELEKQPARLGVCYPPNAHWKHWALAAHGRIQPVLNEFRARWVNLPSVQQNNALQEAWDVAPDSSSQWSHASLAPMYVAYMCIAGLEPLAPGFRKARIWPRLGDLTSLEARHETAQGPVFLNARGSLGQRTLQLQVPAGMEAVLWLDAREQPKSLAPSNMQVPAGLKAWQLPAGAIWEGNVSFT